MACRCRHKGGTLGYADTDPIVQYLVEERRDDDDEGVNFTECKYTRAPFCNMLRTITRSRAYL